ncbi:SPOR domain-containing protein [Halothiobacillus sp. DCM-1]|uniref:SPOR domain-containing protein n=1 Tax=Halothiobacillus sp. DCM-1 TaxID=3112558 RepID=UPI00324FA8E2
MNNTAQQHALEQANLITQLIKYADRVIVVESASDAERRAFVKLIDDQLPESVGVLALRASPNTEQAEIIREISGLLQLSPGIESPRQLAAAIQAALGNQGRLLTIIENADAWYQTTQWSGLMAHIQAANKSAPNHWLFMLTGAPGLTEKLRADGQLAELSADIHRCELLGESDESPLPPQPATVANAEAETLHAEDRFMAAAPAAKKSHGTALLVAAALSVAVVTFGGFALLTRSHEAPSSVPTTQTLALTPPAAPVPPPTAPAQADNPLPNDGANSAPQLAADAASGSSGSSAPAVVPPTPAVTAPAPASAPVVPPSPLPPPVAAAAPAVQEKSPAPPAPPVVRPPEAPAAKPAQEAGMATAKPHAEKVGSEKIQPEKARPEKGHPEKGHPEKYPAKKEPQAPSKTHSVAPVRVTGVDNAWYRQQPGTRAVLQLGAFNEEKAALAFIKTHAPKSSLGDWHIFTQKRGGQLLYTVTAGDFANLTDARNAVHRLPAAAQKIKPYPRSFKAIGEVIQ